MEERLELLQRQQPFPPLGDLGMGLSLTPDSDYLEVARTRSESSDHSSPNITPRASNHSNMSVSELGSSANEHDEGGRDWAETHTLPQYSNTSTGRGIPMDEHWSDSAKMKCFFLYNTLIVK
jgi:hypothetical protein